MIEDLRVSIGFGTKSKSDEPLALSGSLNLTKDNHLFAFVKDVNKNNLLDKPIFYVILFVT